MTQEEKELLLKDLCARLPYRVKCKASHGLSNSDKKHEYVGVLKFVGNCYGVIANYYEDVPHDTGLINNVFYDIEYIKPYLRPMSSMTDEEREEWVDLFMKPICELEQCTDEKEAQDMAPILYGKSHSLSTDWLNKKMFDYHGLILMGLALEAAEDMYK